MTNTFLAAFVLALAGCSAIPVTPAAANIQLHPEKPQGNCQSLGEAIGDQGNWFTGDYTANKDLLLGARNALRNRAAEMGGNYVWLQSTSNAKASGGLGNSNTTVLGMVYKCQ